MPAGMSPHRTVAALLFVLVWLSAAWFGSWEFNPNNATRLFAAISIVEDGDAVIDDFAPLTIDKAQFDGHTYLDKAPGMTLMALPAIAAVTWATGERSAAVPHVFGDPALGRFLRLRQWAAVASGPALLTALAALLLFDLGLSLTGRAGAGLFAALSYGLGSPVWGWSTTITGHAAVAALFVVAVWAFWNARTRAIAALGGVALGWAVVVEYQAVLAGLVIAGWAAWRLRAAPRLLVAATIGGVAALLPLFAYNLFAFGTPFRIAYAGVQGFEGMHQGLFGLGWPRPKVLGEILIGDRRGLLWVAPVLILSPLGWSLFADRPRTRPLALMAAGVIAVVLLVNAAYFYWDGGNATGPRHAIPLIGLAALGLAAVWQAGGATRLAGAGLLALSMAINLMVAAAEVFAPPEYRWPLWSAVFDLRFRRGDLRTFPSEWLGWTPWHGLEAYLAVALPLLALIVFLSRSVPVRPGCA